MRPTTHCAIYCQHIKKNVFIVFFFPFHSNSLGEQNTQYNTQYDVPSSHSIA